MSRIILGCGNFGGIGSAPEFFGQGETRDEAFAIMDAAWDAGITTFDTADAYGGGRSETFIGEWLRTKGAAVRDELVLSTKTFNPMDAGRGPRPRARARQAPGRVEPAAPRRRARRCYLPHDWDPDVPIAETAGALDELVAEGKIGAYGLENVDGAQLEEALAAGDFGWVQNSYSLLDREAERDVLPLCAEHGLGFTPFSPLAGGWLTGKYRRGEPPPAGSRMTLRPEPYEHFVTIASSTRSRRSSDCAADSGTTPAALAIAWLLADPRVSGVVVGPRSPAQLEPALTALDAPVDPQPLQHLFETA